MKSKTTKKKTVISEPKELSYCMMQNNDKCKGSQGMLPLTEFYTSNKKELFSNGKYPICKNCMKEFIYNGEDVDVEKLKKVLRICDMPFKRKEFHASMLSGKEFVGTYFKNIFLNYSTCSWLDSDELGINDVKDDSNRFVMTNELVNKWGKNYTTEEYEWLEKNYLEWINMYKSDTLAEQKTFQFLTAKELDIRRARESGANVDKLEETFRKYMDTANVTPKDAVAANDTDNAKPFGVWVADIEKHKPAEYFSNKELYTDHDSLVSYLDRFIFRPIKNILAKTKDYDKEFSVGENVNGDDVDE